MANKVNIFDYKKFDSNTNYAIEASAGTGKTFNIQKVVKKILEDNKDFTIDNILIVTFTDKAAGELRFRIREELVDVNVDNAPIFTIHSFCQSVINEYSLTIGEPTDLNIVSDIELTNFIKKFIREGDRYNEIRHLLESKITIDENKLVSGFKSLLSRYYLDKNFNPDDSIIVFKESLTQEIKKNLKLIIDSETIYDFFNIYDKKGIDLLSHLQSSGNPLIIDLYHRIVNSFKNEKKFNVIGTYTKWGLDEKDETLVSDYKKIIRPLEKIKDTLFLILFIESNIKDLYIAWQEEKKKNCLMDFNDLIRTVREAILHNDDLKNKLRGRYKYGIIDEFQDTNQLQFDIFKEIFLEGNLNNHLMVVGDPKQSIYSFQGADVQVYKKAVKYIESHGKYLSLNKNYRSSIETVDFFNHIFKTPYYFNDEYQDCEVCRNDNENETVKRTLYQDKKSSPVWVVLNEDKTPVETKTYYKRAVEAIVDCCMFEKGKTKLQIKNKDDSSFRNVSFKDVAILVRTKKEASAFIEYLKAAGIPYINYKDSNLFNGKECASWISLFEAIDASDFTGKKRKLFKKVLFTDFFHYSLAEINDSKFDSDDNEEMDIINEWRYLAKNNQWNNLIDSIFKKSYLSKNKKTLENLSSYSIYKQIGDYCLEYLLSKHTIGDLIKDLYDSKNNYNSDTDEGGSLIAKGTNFDAVTIMTIHASKGLQFPIVICVGGLFPSKSSKKIQESSYHSGDKYIVTLGNNGEDEKEKSDEEKRLLYVAYTRAINLLILPHYKNAPDIVNDSMEEIINNYKDIKFLNPTDTSLKDVYKISKQILDINNPKKETNKKDVEEHKLNLVSLIEKSFNLSTYKHSYSSLSHGEEDEFLEEDILNKEGDEGKDLSKFDQSAVMVDGIYDDSLTPLSFPNDYPKGKIIGTALHEIFEKIDFTSFKVDLENRIMEAFEGQNIKSDNEKWIDVTKEMVNRVLNAKLPIIHGNKKTSDFFSLNELKKEDKKPEIEFNFNLLNGRLHNYCNGFIDLLFVRDGHYSILDWKSDTLNDKFTSYADKDQLKKHVNDSYSIQRVLYCYCLIQQLKIFYPNLSENEIFDNYFGGIYYVCIRGCNENTTNGIYSQTWNSYDDLKKSFDEIIKDKIGG